MSDRGQVVAAGLAFARKVLADAVLTPAERRRWERTAAEWEAMQSASQTAENRSQSVE